MKVYDLVLNWRMVGYVEKHKESRGLFRSIEKALEYLKEVVLEENMEKYLKGFEIADQDLWIKYDIVEREVNG